MDVLVRRVTILPHDNADSLELAQVDDYLCVVRKGDFRTGELAVYIPEQAIVPDYVLEYMGLEGKLSGSEKNVVKAVKLRGVVSQGILLKLESQHAFGDFAWLPTFPNVKNPCVAEGDDVTEILEITKKEHTVPRGHRLFLAGNNVVLPEIFQYTYDIENIKKHPRLFEPNDDVVVTEKIHGTLLCVMGLPTGEWYVSSKGLLSRGVGLDTTGSHNAYVKMALDKRYLLAETAVHFAEESRNPVMLFGELFGYGVQDLTYGHSQTSEEQVSFRLFDIRVNHQFVGYQYALELAVRYGIPTVPTLYQGPFDLELVKSFARGLDTLGGGHIREGVVVKCPFNRRHQRYGRMILKAISDDYLLRKNGTEFN